MLFRARQDPRHPSNRQKLLRYNNKMEQEYGVQWRKVVEDEDREEEGEGATVEKASSCFFVFSGVVVVGFC